MDIDEADTADGGDNDVADTTASSDSAMDADEGGDDDGDEDESDMDDEERAQWVVRFRGSQCRSRRRSSTRTSSGIVTSARCSNAGRGTGSLNACTSSSADLQLSSQ